MTATTPTRVEIPPGTAGSVRLAAGERVRVIDVAGGQVADVFAFVAPAPGSPKLSDHHSLSEHHSAAHTRAAVSRLFPAIGESFVTDRRRPILLLVDDTSTGEHDMLIAACDPARYAGLGAPSHRSCAENLAEALASSGLRYGGPTPQPINIFMRIPVAADGQLSWLAATSAAGAAVTFEAALDCVVVVSACPQDLVGINGSGLSPLAVEVIA